MEFANAATGRALFGGRISRDDRAGLVVYRSWMATPDPPTPFVVGANF